MKESGGGRTQGTPSPCGACKLLRRRCAQDCVFAPYFPADEPHKFANVHKVFGASNVNKMLQGLPQDQRGDAVSSLVYEANARVQDPVHGCVGVISSQKKEIDMLRSQLAQAKDGEVHPRVWQNATLFNHGLSPASPSKSGSPSSRLMASHGKSIYEVDMKVDLMVAREFFPLTPDLNGLLGAKKLGDPFQKTACAQPKRKSMASLTEDETFIVEKKASCNREQKEKKVASECEEEEERRNGVSTELVLLFDPYKIKKSDPESK